MRSILAPTHLLFLHHPFTDHIVHSRFHECRRDRFPVSAHETRFTSNSRNPLRKEVSSKAALSRPLPYSAYGMPSRVLGWTANSVSPAGSEAISASSVAAV